MSGKSKGALLLRRLVGDVEEKKEFLGGEAIMY